MKNRYTLLITLIVVVMGLSACSRDDDAETLQGAYSVTLTDVTVANVSNQVEVEKVGIDAGISGRTVTGQ